MLAVTFGVADLLNEDAGRPQYLDTRRDDRGGSALVLLRIAATLGRLGSAG